MLYIMRESVLLNLVILYSAEWSEETLVKPQSGKEDVNYLAN